MTNTININNYILSIIFIISSLIGYGQDKIIVEITNICSANSEYAPVYYNGGIVFSSVSANNQSNKAMTGLYFTPSKKNNVRDDLMK